MAGQKARKTSSGSKRSKNCETRINRPPSARPARERNVLEFNAERADLFAKAPARGTSELRLLEQAALTQGTDIAGLASRLCYKQELIALYFFEPGKMTLASDRLQDGVRQDGWRIAAPGTPSMRVGGIGPSSERLTFTEPASESRSAADRDIDAALAASEISG